MFKGKSKKPQPPKPAEKTVDLTPIIDMKTLSAVRLSLDQRREDRFPIGEYMDLTCEIGDVHGQIWAPVEILDVSSSGCGCKIQKKLLDRVLATDAKRLQLRFRFRNGQELQLFLSLCRVSESERVGKGFVILGCTVDPTTASYNVYSDLVHFVESLTTLHRQMKLSKVPIAA